MPSTDQTKKGKTRKATLTDQPNQRKIQKMTPPYLETNSESQRSKANLVSCPPGNYKFQQIRKKEFVQTYKLNEHTQGLRLFLK